MRARERRKRSVGRTRTITQRYLRYSYEGETVRLPMVPVRIRIGSRSVRTTALVDSGATASFVPPDFVDILGVALGEPSSASGAGGDFPTRLVTVVIEVLKGNVGVCRFEDEVHVPEEAGRVPYVVLGRDTIFWQYDITFRERRGLLVLRPPRRRLGPFPG